MTNKMPVAQKNEKYIVKGLCFKIFIGLALTLVFISCKHESEPKKPALWMQINDTLKYRWDNYIGTHPVLPEPFTIALGSQQHLYYWDIYFINKGLLVHDRFDLVKNNIDNLTFEIDTFGYIPNATVSWGYDRSQPPFYSMMVRDYYSLLPKKDTLWLSKAYKAALKEYAFWTGSSKINGNNTTKIKGLSRYGHLASDETLASVYDGIRHRFPELPQMTDEEKMKFGADIIAECATGMDFTWRYQQRCTDYISVDLNSNLYAYEKNFIWFEKELGIDANQNWDSLAAIRKKLINKYCWDAKRGLFTDYDFVNNKLNPVVSMAMFWPLYFGLANANQAEATIQSLPLIETDWGMRATQVVESPYKLQWGAEGIWPPVQLMAYGGLKRYGFDAEAQRIAEKYLALIAKNWENPVPVYYLKNGEKHVRESGYTWEKYNIKGELNDVDYPCHKMMGWTAGVYVYLLNQYNE